MSKKKPKQEEQMHQHIDESGIPFGKAHPVDANHKNEKTQKVHEKTMKHE